MGSTARKDLETAATVENEQTTFMPIKTTIAKEEFITTQNIEETTFVPVKPITENNNIESTTTKEIEETTLGPVEAKIRNENIIIPENELFLPFFDEEGSGSEKNMEEIVEGENERREPRIMDDPVLKFLTYRTETSVSKVERV